VSESAALPRFSRVSPAGEPLRFADDQAASPSRPAQTPRIQLASARDFADLRDDWADLVSRAAIPNVFMDPAVATAFACAWPDRVRVLLAWTDDQAAEVPPRLLGAWLLVERHTRLSWPWKALVCPPGPVAYLGTPVIDGRQVTAVLAAMLAAIRRMPELPKLIQAGDMSGGSAVTDALETVLDGGAGSARLLETRIRAGLTSSDDPKAFWAASMSPRRLQGFARKRRQLSKEGELALSFVDEPAAVTTALEEFLRLEASGWKAARHSALASNPDTGRFARELVLGLAERRLVRIEALRLDGKPIAMWVVLLCGDAAFTWRTAYDETYSRFSPGVLLLEHTTMRLLADPTISFTDSCNHRDTGQQAERWPERHEVRDLLIDVEPGLKLRLLFLASREKAYRRGREAARQLYHRLRPALAQLRRRLRGEAAKDPQE
jgi:hypothetical protein